MKTRNIFIYLILQLLLIAPGILSAASFLEDEAGISASTQLGTSVDLNLAETAFKNVERKTTGYIIGSIALDDYWESDDVHVYVDISGEMIAYYLRNEPASKIIDWIHDASGQISGSKLEDALSKVCNALSVSLPEVIYFDFRFPSGNQIKVLVDEKYGSGGETFRFMIPSDHIVYSASWSHATNNTGSVRLDGTRFLLDGVQINSVPYGIAVGWRIYNGELTSAQIEPDVYHEVYIYNSDSDLKPSTIGIVLIYSEAQ